MKAILVLNSGKECDKTESEIAYNIREEKKLVKDIEDIEEIDDKDDLEDMIIKENDDEQK